MGKKIIIAAAVILLAAFLCPACATGKNKRKGEKSACETAGKYYNLAVESYSKRRIVEAKQNLKRGLEMCPSDEKIHNFFGLIHLGEGKLQEALDSFKKALELEPKYTDAMNNIASVYMEKQDWKTALTYLRKVEEDPLYNYPYLVKWNIGWCYYKLGDKKNAKENLKQAVFYEEFMCLAWYVLGIIAKEEGASDEAVSNFQNAVKKNPKTPSKSCENYALAHYELGLLYMQRQEPEKAKSHLETCVKLSSADPTSQLYKDCSKMRDLNQ